MGYSTYFKGTLKFAEPLTAEQELELQKFAYSYLDIRDFYKEQNKDSSKECGEYVSYMHWIINKDKSGLEHDGNEKSYGDVAQVNFIIREMQKKFPDFRLTGGAIAQGEETGDVWKLLIKDGKAIREDIKIEI